MLPNKLPLIIHPEQICRHAPSEGTEMQGIILLGDLNNIQAELKKQSKVPVAVSLLFAVDSDNYCYIHGKIALTIQAICQRCIKPMEQTIECEFVVSPVVSDVQAKQLPERYEPLLVNNGEVVLKEWIAEELNLGLPLVPRHDSMCVSYGNYIAPHSELASDEAVVVNEASSNIGESYIKVDFQTDVQADIQTDIQKKSPFERLKKLKE